MLLLFGFALPFIFLSKFSSDALNYSTFNSYSGCFYQFIFFEGKSIFYGLNVETAFCFRCFNQGFPLPVQVPKLTYQFSEQDKKREYPSVLGSGLWFVLKIPTIKSAMTSFPFFIVFLFQSIYLRREKIGNYFSLSRETKPFILRLHWTINQSNT